MNLSIKGVLALSIVLLFSLQSYSQDFVMSPGSIGVCSGNWYDPGGTKNYNNNTNITQTIYSSSGECLSISFSMFNVDSTGDTLFAYNGSNATFPLIGKYTGAKLPANIVSTNGSLTFKFQSNGSIVKAGWIAAISCVSCSAPSALPTSMTSGTYSACGSIFLDPGGNGNYTNNLSVTTTIYPATAGNNLGINFSSFSLGTGDNLKIYNGSSTSYPLVGIYTGNNSPGTITSSNGALTFVFTSDATNNGAGWNATISCVPINSGCGNCSGAAPVNDYCSNATDLGNLAAPAACPNGLGILKVVSGTNLCATSEAAFSNHTNCSGGAMSSSSADVWYKFNITGSVLNITVTGLDTPQIALYSGTSYIGLMQVGCAVGSNGQVSASFPGLPAGTYYLQVGGGSLADECNFSLVLQNNNDCADCVVQSSLTASPTPVNGAYAPGQTVNFCYTVTNFISQSGNSLHGVVPTFGNGWDVSTFTSVSVPASCSGSGTWSWYSKPVTSSKNNITAGPGWFYETNIGNAQNKTDNNPGDNYGDNNSSGVCQWQFCWSITVKDSSVCVNGKSLDFSVKTYGDGQTGSYTSSACSYDVPYNFNAIISCCDSPTLVITNVSCAGLSNGSVTATGHGVSPYTFTWKNSLGATILTQSNIISAATINNLAVGSYSLLVQDAGGCEKTTSFTISNGTAALVSVNPTSLTICHGQSAFLSATGASSYTWAASDDENLPGNDSVNATPLLTTTYTVTGTNSNGCTANATAIITVNPSPAINSSIVQPTCGNANGAIDLSITGGTGNHSSLWNIGNTTDTLNNLSTGNYSVIVTDADNCSATAGFTINPSSAPVINLTESDVSCANAGGVHLNVSGGIAPYTFSWSNGATTQNLANVSSGGYGVTVTDSSGCTVSSSTLVNNIIQMPVVSVLSNKAACGKSDGSANISVSLGTAPYSFNWNNGDTVQNLLNISSGTYYLTITDAASCSITETVNVGTVNGPSITDTVTNATCGNTNGAIKINVTGGKAPYSFNWNNGATAQNLYGIAAGDYNVAVTDSNSCVTNFNISVGGSSNIKVSDSLVNIVCFEACNAAIFLTVNNGQSPYSFHWADGTTQSNLQGLCPGVYKVTIHDANGCADTSNYFLPIVTEPQMTLQATNVMCNGMASGSLNVVVTDGFSPYSYSWSNGATTPTVSNVVAGTYIVIITDAKGCTYSDTANINELEPLLVFNTPVNEYCNQSNGRITLNVTGGSTPYTFQWNNDVTTQNISGLSADVYTVTVTDKNSCSAVTSVTINNINPQPLNSGQVNSKICAGSSAQLNVTGASVYVWTPATSLNNSTGASVTASPTVSTTYTITATDAYGCTTTVNIPVTVYAAPVITINPAHPSMCMGGAAGINVSGAATYQWKDNGVTYNTTGSNITLLPTQTMPYTIKGTNGFGCVGYDSVVVFVSPLPQVTASVNDSLVCPGSDVTLTAQTSSTGNIIYNWSASGSSVGSTQQVNASPVSNTNYVVTITNASGCTASNNLAVTVKQAPQINLSASAADICSGADVSLYYSGANSYSWSSSSGIITSNNIFTVAAPTSTTTYSLSGKDNATGCTGSKQVVVKVHPLPDVKINPANLNACIGSDITLTASGALQYSWSASNAVTTSTGSTIIESLIQATKFSVTGIDSFGCMNQDTATINVYSRPFVSFAASVMKGCAPLNVSFTNSCVNARGYIWIINDEAVSTDSDFSYIFEAGINNVTLIATGEGGCSDTAVLNSPILSLPSPHAAFTVSPALNTPVLIANATFNFNNLSSDANSYVWNFGDNTYYDGTIATHKYTTAGTYTVSLAAINSDGCTDTLKKSSIIVTEPENVFIPNTFTPNGDGENDVFKIYGVGVRNISFTIYDRGGNEIYHTDNNVPWDGTLGGKRLSMGVYICSSVIEYFTGKKETRESDITLLR